MELRKEIKTKEDIYLLVDTFYAKVRANETIGIIFNTVIQDKWDEHIEKLTRFWQTVLLNEYTYQGAPFQPHSVMPLENKHFDIWIATFIATVDQLFVGEKAEEAKMRAQNMARMFQHKISYLREHNQMEHKNIKDFIDSVAKNEDQKSSTN